VVKERRFCTFYTEGSRDGKSQVIVEERNNPNCTTATVAPPTVLGGNYIVDYIVVKFYYKELHIVNSPITDTFDYKFFLIK